MTAAQLAEEPTTSHGTVKTNAQTVHGVITPNAKKYVLPVSTVTQLIAIATTSPTDQTPLYLLITTLKPGSVYVRCPHCDTVTEPRNNVYQAASAANLPIQSHANVKPPARTHHTSPIPQQTNVF
jgi:hypothetical protein